MKHYRIRKTLTGWALANRKPGTAPITYSTEKYDSVLAAMDSAPWRKWTGLKATAPDGIYQIVEIN